MFKQFVLSEYLGEYCSHVAINRAIHSKVDMDGESMHMRLLHAYLSSNYGKETADRIIDLEREQIRLLCLGIGSKMADFREKVNNLINQQNNN